MPNGKHGFGSLARANWILPAIWLAYCLPRLALISLEVTPSSDAAWYFARAASLAAGGGYVDDAGAPTAFWPPGWPMALGTVFRLAGPSILAVGLFNFLCAVVSGWLLLDLTRYLTGREGTARLALLLYAVYPNAIGYVPLALTEIFYTMLLLAGTRLLVARPRATVLIAAGILFGFASLVKAQTIVVIPLILAIVQLRRPGRWRTLGPAVGRGLLVAGLAMLTVLPWTLRNHSVMDAWIPVSANGGYTLLTGNNDDAAGGYTTDTPVVRNIEASGLGELKRDERARDLALAWIADHPGRFAALMPRTFWCLWAPDGEAEWGYQAGFAGYDDHAALFRAVRILNQLYYAALLAAFALFTILQLRRRWRGPEPLIDWWLLPYALAAYPSAIAIIFSGQSRFHFPVMPFIILTAAWLLTIAPALRRPAQRKPDARGRSRPASAGSP